MPRPLSTAHPSRPSKTNRARRGGRSRAADIEALQDQVFALTDQLEKMRIALSAAGNIVLRHGATPYEPPQPIGPAYADMFDLDPRDLMARLQTLGPEALTVSPPDDDVARQRADRPLPTRTGERWFTCALMSLPGPDGEPILHTVLSDVTDRKATEAALAKARDSAEAASQAKSRFLALASHELRTPLNGILGMAGLLHDTALTPEQESYVHAITASGEALLGIVGDVLDHARIEAGRLEIAPAITDPAVIVRDVVELLAPRAHAKSIEIAADLGPGLPQRALLDGPRLRQVLLNLAGNAIKFTEVGGVAVRARLSARDLEPRLVISVEDTGIGLTPDDAERVFHEFEQADQGTARRADGTGLGLSIARAIVRAMGGDIRLESAPGRGSTFSFALPLGLPLEGREGEARAELAGRRVLVISDAAIEPPIVCRRLAEAGAEVGRAPDLAAARVHWAAASAMGRVFDTLLVDHRFLADADGLDAFAAFRATVPASIRAIVLLAPSERGGLDRLRARGIDGYLTRPIRNASLIAVLARSGEDGAAFAPDPRDRATGPSITDWPAAARALDVLIVDDNPINALLARALVSRLGHRVEVVADGMAALIAVKRGPAPTADPPPRSQVAGDRSDVAASSQDDRRPDGGMPARPGDRGGTRRFAAVLTDLHMPGRDGFDLIRAIRADEARHGHAPARLIAVTADARPDVAATVREAGGDATLTKPFDPVRLAALLADASSID